MDLSDWRFVWLILATIPLVASLQLKPQISVYRREPVAPSPRSSSPTLVSLRGSKGDHVCTGTLIAPNVVLAAAHCLLEESSPVIYIRNELSSRGYEIFKTVRTIVHPQFSPERLEYDAALLVLNAPSSRPLTLLESSDSCFKDRRSSCSLAISRFDSPDFMDDGTSIKWFRAKSVNSSECSMFLEHQNLQVETTFCTRGLGRSSCEILADGPLLSKRVQVGIPSRSNKATTCQDSLSAYTSVPTLLPWITAEIESLEEGDDCTCSRYGFSGGVRTPWRGCKQHMPLNLRKFSCMVEGGSNCSLATPSLKYPGAAWRLCGTLVSRPKSEDDIDDSSSSCNFVWGVEFSGEALNNGKDYITNSELECCTLCDETEGCRAWTRINRKVDDKHLWGECWLKKESGTQLLSDFSNSGSKSGKIAKKLTSCGSMHGVDLAGGGTLNNGRVTISQSESECCQYCDSTPECEAWTRITRETEANQWGQCWLWNRTNIAGTTDFTSSGVMGGKAVEFFHEVSSAKSG